ncbi:phospholipase A [Sphingomonas sp. 28-63-12]|uniref:phospholipase A n=1 Tax=Sphingomonas sp. 28-63-12 TaxID=1970434 RepID=UPI000BC62A49|nr:MAG: hypothetical protein B7Y47_10510 [Sphingomonas sp. 28-63-12]
MRYLCLAPPFLVIATPAAAQLRPLVEPPASAARALSGVDVFLLNEGRAPAPVEAPATIQTIAQDGTALTLELIRSTADTGSVAPGGFARLRYRLAPVVRSSASRVAAATLATSGEEVATTGRGTASGFLGRFSPFEPVYGVIGSGDAGAKVQLSFAMQPFASTGPASYIKVGYTQTIFWALDLPSGPIRATTYSPEAFIDVPVDDGTRLAIGFRHDSNGGGPATSVDINRFYLRANKSFALGSGWRLDIAPQGWFYVGGQGAAGNIERFYGYGALGASIEQRDGIKLALFARGNPVTRLGSAELFASYPIKRFAGGDIGLYLFGQAFHGYGEALSDYNRADTHARIGLAFTR